MMPSIDCPDDLLLRQFLDGSDFTDASQTSTRERIEQHVNECESCQRSIERLVAGQESWEGAAHQLAEIDAARSGSSFETPALRQLIDQAKGRVPGGMSRQTQIGTDVASTELPIEYLQPSDQPDSLGRIGSYEILGVVGRGGMGLVLKAYDPSLRRIVAIKVMAAHLASCPAARRRFVREARAAAAVSHDHVVAIYAVEENHEPPFLVMQFIGGKTLQDRLTASGSLAVTEVLRIGMQTAFGLVAAHAQGLVHRDIKPANILLENGVERVKITDFGLARAVDDVGMTQTGVVAGTPQFMAPEQANGEAIDLRSDLFSLGSVLYTLCTGRPPFRATTTMGLLKKICEETPRPIRELNPEIPEWLDKIIAKLLKKNPTDRYQTAKEVAELLSGWLAHVQRPTTVPAPTAAKVDPSTPETPKQQQRHGMSVGMAPVHDEEKKQRKMPGMILMCWAIVVPALLDAFWVWQNFWRYFVPRFLEIVPISSILFGLPVAFLIYNRQVKRRISVDPMQGGSDENQSGAELRVRTSSLPAESAAFNRNSVADSLASSPTIDNATGLLFRLSQLFWGDYSHSLPFNGDAARAFDLAVASLSAGGFMLNRRNETELSFSGPGLNGLRGNPLAAASSIEVRQSASRISLDANLGTLRSLHAFLLGLLVIACLLLFVVRPRPIAVLDPVAFIALVVVGTFVALSIVSSQRAIRKAFDRLLGNLAKTGIPTGLDVSEFQAYR